MSKVCQHLRLCT